MNVATGGLADALEMVPRGVAALTVPGDDGLAVTVPVESFASVSLDPPLISFTLAKDQPGLSPLLQADSFVVNVLAESRHKVAAFTCRRHSEFEVADRLIVIGEVLDFEVDAARTPLVRFRGRLCAVGPQVE